MSRYKYFGYARDGHGHVIGNATVSVYEAGGNTAASIYGNNSGGNAINSVTSGNNGLYEFYVDGNDYGLTQKFKISIAKSGFTTSTVDNVNVIVPGSILCGTRVRLTSAQTITGGNWTTLEFNYNTGGEIYSFDAGSGFNTTDYSFTPSTAGYYLLMCSAVMSITSSENKSQLILGIYSGNNQMACDYYTVDLTIDTSPNLHAQCVSYLDSNNTITFQLYCDDANGSVEVTYNLSTANIWRLA